MKKLLYCIPLLLIAWSCSTTPTTITNDVPNLRQVGPGAYRGGQPVSSNGWAYIRFTLNCTNDVKLNLESEGSDVQAAALGMAVKYYPIDVWQQILAKPSAQVVSNAVASIVPGTYFHCEHGQDRTGLIAACYRIWHDGWTKRDARVEMLADGFHTSLHGLNDFFEDDVH